MYLTQPASEAILSVMSKKGLSFKEFAFDISVQENGAVGIGFTRKRTGEVYRYGDLIVTVGKEIDMTGVAIDFGEVNGKKGIFFLEEKQLKAPNPATQPQTPPKNLDPEMVDKMAGPQSIK